MIDAAVNSDAAIVSVEVLEYADACIIHRYSPLDKDGAVWLQPLSVPPDSTPVENVYVNVPVGSDGAEAVDVLRKRETVAVL
jgi:hypothetical protein